MTYLAFMNYIMLVAICGHMGIITSDNVWIGLDILGVVALAVHLCSKDKKDRIGVHSGSCQNVKPR